MNKIKATFARAPKTADEDYDRRKKALKDLNEALRMYKSAMEKAKASVKTLVDSLTSVNEAFDKLTSFNEVPNNTRDLSLAFAASCERIKSDYWVRLGKAMDDDVLPATTNLKKMYEECSSLEAERNKQMQQYDYYYYEASKTESEYAKKGKDLALSKSYEPNCSKANMYKGKFVEADRKFKDSHDFLLDTQSATVTGAMLAYLRNTSEFVAGVTHELESLTAAATQVSVHPGVNSHQQGGQETVSGGEAEAQSWDYN